MRYQLTAERTSGSPIPIHLQANGAPQVIIKELKICYFPKYNTKSQIWRECKRKKEIVQAELGETRYRGVSFNLENLVFINICALIEL